MKTDCPDNADNGLATGHDVTFGPTVSGLAVTAFGLANAHMALGCSADTHALAARCSSAVLTERAQGRGERRPGRVGAGGNIGKPEA